MFPDPDAQPVSLDSFHALEGVVDVIYNPLRSRLVLDARSRGIPADGGLYMLVAQAVRASELFQDTTRDEDLCDIIHDAVLRWKENLVLIGMPGSGKTTVGRYLIDRTGKKLRDTDRWIEKKAGKTIFSYSSDWEHADELKDVFLYNNEFPIDKIASFFYKEKN